MTVFSNGISVAANKNADEILLTFVQSFPAFDDEGHVSGERRETVSSVVVSRETAQELNGILTKLLSI